MYIYIIELLLIEWLGGWVMAIVGLVGCGAMATVVLTWLVSSSKWLPESFDILVGVIVLAAIIGGLMGCVVGVALVNRKVSGITGWNIAGMALGMVLSVIGFFAVLWLTPHHFACLPLCPVVSTCLAMFGYHLCLRRKKANVV